MMIAQAIDNVPADFLKWFGVVMLALLFAAATIFSILSYFKKHKTDIHPDPLNVEAKVRPAAKRFNHDHWDTRVGAVEERMDSIEEDVKEIHKSRAAALQQINDKLEEMPSRIIADLANAKKIFKENL